jgi:hypothetical protein
VASFWPAATPSGAAAPDDVYSQGLRTEPSAVDPETTEVSPLIVPGSLQLPLLFLSGPACGRPAAALGRQPAAGDQQESRTAQPVATLSLFIASALDGPRS